MGVVHRRLKWIAKISKDLSETFRIMEGESFGTFSIVAFSNRGLWDFAEEEAWMNQEVWFLRKNAQVKKTFPIMN